MARLSRRETKKLQNRNAILAAAEELFSDRGFKETTMQEVADRAGLSKGAVYLYFKSKEELFLTVCIKGIAGFGERIEAAREAAHGVEAKIRAVYLAYIRHSLQEPAVFRVLRDTFIEHVRHNLSHRIIEETSTFIKEWLEGAGRLVQGGIDSGVLRADLDSYAFSVTAWRMATGLIELALLEEPIVIERGELEKLFENSIDMLIAGSRAG